MAWDPELHAHQEWLGLLQPVGVVASAPALLAAQAHVDRNTVALRESLRTMALPPRPPEETGPDRRRAADVGARVRDFQRFAHEILGWTDEDLVPGDQLPETLRVPLPEYGEELAPSWAVRVASDDEELPTGPRGNAATWLMLVHVLPDGYALDVVHGDRGDTGRWVATPQARFERLLRETGVAIGLLFNGTDLRLVYQPVGESSGHVTFPVGLMCESTGALALGALRMLLHGDRLFTGETRQRLPAILRESRKFQNEVSEALAAQMLDALWELLRGFQVAHVASGGRLLRENPQVIYGGLLTTLLRLVFVLYAEDQGLFPVHAVYREGYSIRGLFETLREDSGRHPDSMELREGAWGRLIALFRLIHDGGGHGDLHLPPRYGRLFDPSVYPFLEGRAAGIARDATETLDLPKIADGVVHRVLAKLLVLDGEALSYRTLDVEQLGGVYEAIMGFTVEAAGGPAIGVSPDDVVIDLGALLASTDRAKHLKAAGCELTGKSAEALKTARTVSALVEALGRRVSRRTPEVLAAGDFYLQPTEERRRSGSHYTPRALTEPIVRTTLRPVLEALALAAPGVEGRAAVPTPDGILGLKVCDPAMGSGAFLVAACRHLADVLVRAWEVHGGRPAIPPDEDEVLHARRLVAQHCLYGVDRNPFAVDLAKLSLWLVTLAREHPFTFVDHALRLGDSLVGLSREQIASLTIELAGFTTDTGTKKGRKARDAAAQPNLLHALVGKAVREADGFRGQIRELAGSDDTGEKRRLLDDAEKATADVRLLGDAVVEAFFGDDKRGKLKQRLADMQDRVWKWRDGRLDRAEIAGPVAGLRERPQPLRPFHWEVEFPEVFARENPGFDGIVGNPPFMGGTMISTSLSSAYLDVLTALYAETGGRADMVAYFFRRAFGHLREGGTFGLIATNTIAQGDTRRAGLQWICEHGGSIFEAQRRFKWPGLAAVIVSIVHVNKGGPGLARVLDGQSVETISAFLFHAGGHASPSGLAANAGSSFEGCKPYGDGFLFEDGKAKATPISVMRDLLAKDPANGEVIFPFIGGDEINTSPTHEHDRYIINFAEMPLAEARRWPDLLAIAEAKVRPERATKAADVASWPWWQFWRLRRELHQAINGKPRVLVCARHQPHWTLAMVSSRSVFSEGLNVFSFDSYAAFTVLQSRPHEVWARFFASSMKDDMRYTPSDCFETFPFPADWETNAALEAVGKAYYAHRAAFMVAENIGMTKTYNRFNDPDERDPRILELRALHDAMDRAVLDAYGWSTIRPACAFVADYVDEDDPDEGATSGRTKRKPLRWRWPDEVRDEVLARLVDLNAQRAREERALGGGG